MALAIDTIDGRGLSNEVHFLPKKRKVRNAGKRRLTNCNQLYLTNKAKHFSFKSGHVMWVVKLIKEDWPSVTVKLLA